MKPQYLFAPALALALAGCANTEVILCPSASVLADTASLTVFRRGAPMDPSGEAYTVAITGVKSSCHYAKGASDVPTDLSFDVRATRAPDSVSARASAISAFFWACSSQLLRTPWGLVSTRALTPVCSASSRIRLASGKECEQTSTGGMALPT